MKQRENLVGIIIASNRHDSGPRDTTTTTVGLAAV
jgi:hypothetical protein